MHNIFQRVSIVLLLGSIVSGCAGMGASPVLIEENVIVFPGDNSGYYIYEFEEDANIKLSSALRPAIARTESLIRSATCRCSLIVDSIDEAGIIKASEGSMKQPSQNLISPRELEFTLIDPSLPGPPIGYAVPVKIHAVQGSGGAGAVRSELRRQSNFRAVYENKKAERLAKVELRVKIAREEKEYALQQKKDREKAIKMAKLQQAEQQEKEKQHKQKQIADEKARLAYLKSPERKAELEQAEVARVARLKQLQKDPVWSYAMTVAMKLDWKPNPVCGAQAQWIRTMANTNAPQQIRQQQIDKLIDDTPDHCFR